MIRVHHEQRLFIVRNLHRMNEKLQNMYLCQKWVQRYLRRYCKEVAE